MALPIHNGGRPHIPTQRPQQVQDGWLQRLGKKLGVIPQPVAQKVVNQRDGYGKTPNHILTQRSMDKVLAGRVPAAARVQNGRDPQLVAYLENVMKNGINV